MSDFPGRDQRGIKGVTANSRCKLGELGDQAGTLRGPGRLHRSRTRFGFRADPNVRVEDGPIIGWETWGTRSRSFAWAGSGRRPKPSGR